MNTIKLTDKELELIKDMLIEKIRYKGVQKLMVKIQNQLQEQDKLIYVEKEYLKVFETDKELVDWLRSRGVEGTDEYIINEALQIGEIEQIKRSELTDTE
jgi:hypothetical protein